MHVLLDEYETIRNMQVIDREVFFYLAQRTDNKTGVVGRRVRVSRGGIALDLSERVEPGRRNQVWVISMDDVKNSINRLVKAGLFKRFSKAGKGESLILSRVFLVDLLQRDKSVQKQVTRRLSDRLPDCDSELSNNNNELETKTETGYPTKTAEVTRTNIHQHQYRADEPFSMRLDWTPNQNDLAMILQMAGGALYSLNKIDQAWITEFVTYWWGRSERKHTERQWTHRLSQQIIGYFRNPGLFEQQRGVRLQQERDSQYVEKNNQSLPGWARPPRDDNALVGWMQSNGYGDAPMGYDWQETRGWLRREIDKRVASNGMPKIVH